MIDTNYQDRKINETELQVLKVYHEMFGGELSSDVEERSDSTGIEVPLLLNNGNLTYFLSTYPDDDSQYYYQGFHIEFLAPEDKKDLADLYGEEYLFGNDMKFNLSQDESPLTIEERQKYLAFAQKTKEIFQNNKDALTRTLQSA